MKSMQWITDQMRVALSYQFVEMEDFYRQLGGECRLIRMGRYESYWEQASQATTAAEGQQGQDGKQAVGSKCSFHLKKNPTYCCALSHARTLCSVAALIAVDAGIMDRHVFNSLAYRVAEPSPTSSPMQPRPSPTHQQPTHLASTTSPSAGRGRRIDEAPSGGEGEYEDLAKWDINYAADPWVEMCNNAKRSNRRPYYESYYY
jgi:hypothetical protein